MTRRLKPSRRSVGAARPFTSVVTSPFVQEVEGALMVVSGVGEVYVQGCGRMSADVAVRFAEVVLQARVPGPPKCPTCRGRGGYS